MKIFAEQQKHSTLGQLKKEKPVKALMKALVSHSLNVLKIFNACHLGEYQSQELEKNALLKVKKDKPVKASMKALNCHSLNVPKVFNA